MLESLCFIVAQAPLGLRASVALVLALLVRFVGLSVNWALSLDGYAAVFHGFFEFTALE